MQSTNPTTYRRSWWGLCLVVIWLQLEPNGSAFAQSTAWQPLTISNGVDIAFIVHRYGDGQNAGVVVRLTNRNQTEASYRFSVIFRSGDRTSTSDLVQGVLQPLEIRTGEMSGLWWIPFRDGAPITEVGLKGLRVSVAASGVDADGAEKSS